MKRDKLLRSKEWWLTHIQNDLYNIIKSYKESNGKKNVDIAKKLKVSKGYVSQLLSGNYDHKLSKMVELALEFGKAPQVEFIDIEDYIKQDELNLKSISITVPANYSTQISKQSSLREYKNINSESGFVYSDIAIDHLGEN